jgi:LacI family transcriptional regulator
MRANVSKATVSRYINNKGVSKGAQEKIQKAINDLNFVPNKIAQGLSNSESNLISIIIPDLVNPFFCEIVNIIQQQAHLDGYNCLVFSTNDDLKAENDALAVSQEFRVKGIIIASIALRSLPKLSVPIIAIDRKIDNCTKNIVVDNYKIGQQIGAYFNDRKATNILYFSGTDKVNTSLDRIAGFRDYCDKNKLSYKIVNTSYSDVYQVTKDVSELSDINQYNGLFMGNEIIALSLSKVSLPKDIIKLTIDGTYLNDLLLNSIACIKQPFKEMALLAYQNILSWNDVVEIIELEVEGVSNE